MSLVRESERRLADASYTSAFHYKSANHYVIEFPENVRGLTIVELCSGASNIVKSLSDQGANAYGVDVLYKQPFKRVERTVQESLDSFHRKANKARKSIQGVDLANVSDFAVAINPDLLNAKVNDSSYDRASQQAAEEFLKDFLKNRSRYVGNLASNLSFLEDDSVDFMFSIQGVSKFLASDLDVLNGVVNEALRVLKRNKELHLYPWRGRQEAFWNSSSLQNLIAFERSLDQASTEHKNELTSGEGNRLIVIKP
jgi:hypothetical protein